MYGLKKYAKKILCGTLAAAMALQMAAVSVTAQESGSADSGTPDVLFEDNFDSGSLREEWQIPDTAEVDVVDDGTGNYVLKLRPVDGEWGTSVELFPGKSEWQNYSVEADFVVNEWIDHGDAGMKQYDNIGLAGHSYTSPEQRWEIMYRRASQTFELNKYHYSSGGNKVEELGYELELGKVYKMKLTFEGEKVSAYVAPNGEEYGDPIFTTEQSNVKDGGIRLSACGAEATFDNVKVEGIETTIPVEKVELDKTEMNLEKGEKIVLNATVTPSTVSDKSVTWSSSNEEVAVVDKESGMVTAQAEGTAVITATSAADPSKTASCTVTVYETAECSTFYYVSTTGSDENPGTEEAPFATVQKARDTIRQLETLPEGGITVYLRGGEYYQDESITFTPEDSGEVGKPIVYTSYPGEEAVITSGKEITNWEKADENLPYTTEEAKGHIYVADVEKGWRFHDLYIDGERQQVSRQVNSDSFKNWIKIDTSINDNVNPQFDSEKGHKIYFGDNSLEGLPDNGDIEINLMAVGFWNALPVLRDFDYEENSAYMNSYNPLYFVDGSIFDNGAGTYNIMNAYKFIDEAGEWCVDSENGKVYLWPKDEDLESQKVIVPKAYRIVEFQGDKEEENFEDQVEYITLKDLEFSYTDRLPEDEFPADWVKRYSENPDAAIYMDGVANCVIEGCKIKNTGTYGIALCHYAQNNEIVGNSIVGTGAGGIELMGYGAGTLDVNHHNVIRRNYISDLGLAPYMHAGAVSIFGSNHNEIEYNKIENVPYSSISVAGTNWQVMSGFIPGDAERTRHFGVDSYGNFFGQYGARYEELDPIRLQLHPDGGDFTREEVKQFKHDGYNVIRHNITEEYMMKTDDGGCLYTWGCDVGNLFEENIIYKSESGHGWVYPLYMDDEVDGTILKGNRIWAPQTSTVNKGDNTFTDNLSSSNMSTPPDGYQELYDKIVAVAEAEGGWLEDTDSTVEIQEVSMVLGSTEELDKDSLPEETDFTWISSNPSVVMVNQNGTVTAVNKGSTMVKAMADGKAVAKWYITVNNNVALNKEVVEVSSHTDWPTEQKECLTDGNIETKWCSDRGTPQWAVVDLGEEKEIVGWRVYHANIAGEGMDKNTMDFSLQYSNLEAPSGNNDEDWVTADEVVGNTETITERALSQTIKARYIRLYIPEPVQASQGSKIARIYELELFGEDEQISVGTIADIPAQERTVSVGTEFEALELPNRIPVVLEDGTSYLLSVEWDADNYHADKAGTYTLKATFTNPLEKVGLSNPEDLEAVAVVHVVNKTLLQMTYEYALNQSTEGVTDSAKKFFEDAVAAAEAVLNDSNATQEEVDSAWENLVDAIHGLGLVQGDKSDLKMLIEMADEMVANIDKYVSTNWQQLVDALAEAKDVYNDGDAMEEDIQPAADALLNAILAQRFKANKSNLEDLINKAESIDLSQYTEESVTVFRAALMTANLVLTDDTLSEEDQDIVDTAAADLKQAMDNLEKLSSEGNQDESSTDSEEADKDNSNSIQKPSDENSTGGDQSKNPSTGDSNHNLQWIIFGFAVVELGVILLARRRRAA